MASYMLRSCFCGKKGSASVTSSLSPSMLSAPLLLLPPVNVIAAEENPSSSRQRAVKFPFFSLADGKIMELLTKTLPEDMYRARCVGSSNGWLAFLDSLKCSFYLANIFSPSPSPEIIQLPPMETLPNINRVLRDSSSNDVSSYELHFNMENRLYRHYPHQMDWHLIRRFAMSSSPNSKKGCTVLVSHSIDQALAFCQIGGTSWTHLRSQFQNPFVEVMYSRKDQIFYALTYNGELEAWDLRNDVSPKRIDIGFELSGYEDEILANQSATEYYLVESCGGDILYVVRYYVFVGEDGSYVNALTYPENTKFLPLLTTKFDVFKLDFKKQLAEPLTSIGDRALFVGYNHSFSLSASDYPTLEPNSIYFGDTHEFDFYSRGYPYRGYDSGVYHLEDWTVAHYHPLRFSKILPAPIWVSPWH